MKQLVFLLLFVACIAACTKEPEPSGDLSVTVFDICQRPVSNVTVSVRRGNDSTVKTTNGKGAIEFRSLAPDTYTLRVAMLGFDTLVENIAIPNQEKTEKKIQLTNRIPLIKTGKAVRFTHNSMVLSDTICSIGEGSSLVRFGHLWSRTGLPTLYDYGLDTSVFATEYTTVGNGVISSTANNLLPNTEYFVRAYIENSVGWVFESEGYSIITRAAANQAEYLQGDARFGALAFTIGNDGYVGMGKNAAPLSDWWKYNPDNDSWTQVAAFGGEARIDAVACAVGDKGYVGLGWNKKDWWMYDATSNQWTPKADLPQVWRSGATAFVVENKIFVVGGEIQNADTSYFTTDCWAYDASADSWVQRSSMPTGTGRKFAASFALQGVGYVGTGFSSHAHNDFYQYTPTNDTWVAIDTIPAQGRWGAVAFASNNKGFVALGSMGSTADNILADCWAFDPATKSWTAVNTWNIPARTRAVTWQIQNKHFIGTGFSTQPTNDVYWFAP